MIFPKAIQSKPRIGFVINIYDALNYDIDFLQTSQLTHVISNEYTYKNIIHGQLSDNIKSKSYRCRLNGIKINTETYNRKQITHYTYELKKLIDRVDGIIEVNFVGIDIFQRLLVDIFIPSLNINLRQYLLAYENFFTKYTKHQLKV